MNNEENFNRNETNEELNGHVFPPASLLKQIDETVNVSQEEIERKIQIIEQTFKSLKIKASIKNVVSGPSVTRFEVLPSASTHYKKILGCQNDLAYALNCRSVRIALFENGMTIGIEIQNNSNGIIGLKEIIEDESFTNTKFELPIAIGKDVDGKSIVRGLEKMPHLLIAGATGTDKSVFINNLIMSLIYKRTPEDLRLLLVDPKQVEYVQYRNLPHLLLSAPITELNHAINALDWLFNEMNRRYDLFRNLADEGIIVHNVKEYNSCSLVKEGKAEKMPYIVMIVDELADLMLFRKQDIERKIRTLVQKCRASGIHLVLATQRPSVKVLTGTIKCNFSARIAFRVNSEFDSKVILDYSGAELLIGRGDMLMNDDYTLVRVQNPFVSNEEINDVVNFVKENYVASFDTEIAKTIMTDEELTPEEINTEEINTDLYLVKLFPDIMRCFIKEGKVSTNLLQRRFNLGYIRADRIIEQFEQQGWVTVRDGTRPQKVNLTEEDFEEIFNETFEKGE
ncbi:MAG: DNA translocase FtsK [Clostridia bacterium]|nr:DNA translocase FtsK [Clostridia bacterium]